MENIGTKVMFREKKRVACIFGTRPEAIKMAPVIRELAMHPDLFDVYVVSTGQHRELLMPLIDWFELSVDLNMDVMSPNQGLNQLSARLLSEFGKLFSERNFDAVIAQGDTTSVFAAGIASFHSRIPFFHVEAGLRTHDMNFPFPEEMNRVLVGRLASHHFAPTLEAAKNLISEGIEQERVHAVGNTVIDALHYTRRKLQDTHDDTAEADNLVLVTAHRRENFGEPMIRICRAIKFLAEALPATKFVFPVHPNPNVKQVVYENLGGLANIDLIDPVPYPEMVDYLRRCKIVLTDSGGLQEEAPALGKPVLVLRDETERPELVAAGGSMLVGSSERMIIDQVMTLLTDDTAYKEMVIGHSPYGDGTSSRKIAAVLARFFGSEDIS